MNKGGEDMLKRIVQACFIIIGGTLGIFLLPELLKLVGLSHYVLINNPYATAIFGAIIFLFYFFLGCRVCCWVCKMV